MQGIIIICKCQNREFIIKAIYPSLILHCVQGGHTPTSQLSPDSLSLCSLFLCLSLLCFRLTPQCTVAAYGRRRPFMPGHLFHAHTHLIVDIDGCISHTNTVFINKNSYLNVKMEKQSEGEMEHYPYSQKTDLWYFSFF